MELLEVLALTAPEFSVESEDLRKQYLAMADEEVPSKIQGTTRTRAVTALAAHYMTLGFKRRDGTGEISSMTEGEVSVTYVTSKGRESSGDLNLTNYGRIYARLIKGQIIAPMTRMCL